MGWFSKKRPSDRTEEIASRRLDGDFVAYPLGEGRPTEAMTRAVAAELGVKFPDAFVAHVCGWLPGVFLLARETVWPSPKPLDVGPFWTFRNGLQTFTPLRESEDWMRLDVVGRDFQARTGLAATPILKIRNDANLFCVDPAGDLFEFDHEENSLTPLNLDFWELFEREVEALVERKNRWVREHSEPIEP